MKPSSLRAAGYLQAAGAALLLACAASAKPLAAQQTTPPPATIQVEFTNPNLSPQHWKLSFDEQGNGQFDAEPGPASAQPKDEIALGEIHHPVQLSPEFTAHVFTVAHQRRLFAFPCDSHMKVAFQGSKRLTYIGPEGTGSCEFNYAKDKSIQELGDDFMALANTIVCGERLEKYLQHDRLGLDKQMEELYASSQSHNAIEMTAIRPILDKIAGDEQVLERARRWARLLLAQAH